MQKFKVALTKSVEAGITVTSCNYGTNEINNAHLSITSRAQAEKEVREQEIIELQTEAANLEAVSNKATAMAEKIGGLLS